MPDRHSCVLQTPEFGLDRNSNELHIPPSYLQFPLIEETLPAYLSFAALGQMIGQQLGYAWRYYIDEQNEKSERLEEMDWIIKQADVRYSTRVFGEIASC